MEQSVKVSYVLESRHFRECLARNLNKPCAILPGLQRNFPYQVKPHVLGPFMQELARTLPFSVLGKRKDGQSVSTVRAVYHCNIYEAFLF